MSANSKFRLSAIILAFCLAVSPVLVVAQDFLISKGRDDLNRIPRAAVNTSNGQVFVVWRGAVEGDAVNFEIYSALLKPKSNGKVRVKKVRKVGPENHQFFHFDVAYDPFENRYLVIWNGADEDELVDSLYGQFFKANGKPLGDRFRILSDSQFSPLFPVLSTVPVNVTAPAPEGARFLTAYSWNNAKIGDATGNGLRTMFLDADGLPVGTANDVFSSELDASNRPSTFINERLFPSLGGKFILTTGHELDAAQVIDEPMIFSLFAFGNTSVSRTLALDNHRFLSSVEINKNNLLLFWSEDQDYIYHLLKPSDLTSRKKTTPTIQIGFAGNSELVKLGDDRGALHFVFRTTSIRVYYVDKKGNTDFNALGDIELGKPMEFSVFAVPLPDSNRVLVLFSEKTTPGNGELRGLVYEPDLP